MLERRLPNLWVSLKKQKIWQVSTLELNDDFALTPPVVSGQTNALAHPMYPYDEAEVLAMPHLRLALNGDVYYSDENGGFVTTINQSLNNVPVSLGSVGVNHTNGITPSGNLNFNNGYNVLTVPGNTKEASAYRSTSLIHDHMRDRFQISLTLISLNHKY